MYTHTHTHTHTYTQIRGTQSPLYKGGSSNYGAHDLKEGTTKPVQHEFDIRFLWPEKRLSAGGCHSKITESGNESHCRLCTAGKRLSVSGRCVF